MALMNLTEAAQDRVKNLMESRGQPSVGMRIGVKTKGCNGLSYFLEYADTQDPEDEIVVSGDLQIFVDPKAVMFLVGTEMDYIESPMQSGFVFRNPNAKGHCGCGKSFSV